MVPDCATREYGITTAVQGYNLSETVDKQRIRMRLALYAHYSTSGGSELRGWSYELAAQHGLQWKALFPQEQVHVLLLRCLGVAERLKNRLRPIELPQNTPMLAPDLLLECGMPFVKAKLLVAGGNPRQQVESEFAMHLLEASNLPANILDELRVSDAPIS